MANKKSKIVTIDNPVLPDFAESSLLTVGERSELLYVYRDKDGKVHSKFVSPEDVARAYAKLSYDTGDIPAGIMRMGYGPNGYWGFLKTEPQLVQMSFLNDRAITVPIPGTILFGVGSQYRIYAEKNGKLFQPPFDNVFSDGRICWGNNKVSNVRKAADLYHAWKLFFAAPFTHRNDANNGQLTYKPLYEALAKSKAKKFKGTLKEHKMTTQSLVKIALGNGPVNDD